MSLKKYITESERAVAFPITGDVLEVVVREDFDDEIAIDFPVVEHTDDSITLHLDEYAYGILEACNYVGDDTDGVIDPPSEELDEAMVSLDKGREYFFRRHDFGDENIAYEFNKLARKMSPEDAEILKKELIDLYSDDVGLNEKKIDEGMHQKCCCKYCGDELYKPTTDCPYDSQDPDGENWVMIDVDGDGDADAAISNEGYRSITTEGTLLERLKDGKIYCPDACCGVKVMDCTCGAKCPHCNCKQIQKLAGDIKMFEEQADLYKRMGVPSSAEYYTRKLTEAVEQTEKLIEDVEDVEAMITRRIMNHPEFSDMVRQYGIEQITQAIRDTAEFHGDDSDEIGSSDISAMVNDTIKSLKRVVEADIAEAEYRGRKVELNKPMAGDVKKFKVYVKDPKTGNVKKVNFGHGGTSAKKAGQKTMRIRKNNPKARKSFRARHNCDNPGPKTKARYWSCRKW